MRLSKKRRDLNSSYTRGCVGRNNIKSSLGSSGHTGDTRPGEERGRGDFFGRGDGGGLFDEGNT
jgi:hypothetical protein